MANFAQLGIQIDSRQAEDAASDLDKLTAAGGRAEESTKRLTKATQAQEKELSDLLGQIDPTVRALGRLDEQERKLAQFRKSGQLDTESYTRYNAQLQQNRQLLGGVADAQNKAGMSARAYSAAMRNVPAQITDITTSLVGGQPAYLVLLQQGGQLKDMFGGIVPAARALASTLVSMINPLTISAAVIGTLGVAFYQASARTEEINLALISTGRNATYTAEGIEKLAASIDSVSGVTQGGAISAITSLATTTNLTGEALTSASAAATSWASVTGQSADTVLDKFRAIAKDPVDALTKLNETERFLTETQYQRIKALQDEGKWQEAATEAAKLYADVVAGRTREVEANLGLISTAWLNIKKASSEAWDGVVSNVNRALVPLQRYADYLDRIGGATQKLGAGGLGVVNPVVGAFAYFGGNANRGRPEVIMPGVGGETRTPEPVRDELARKRADDAKKSADDAAAAWDRVLASTDKEIQKRLEIQRIRDAGNAAGQSEEAIQRQVDAYTSSIAKSSASSSDSTRSRQVALTEEQKAAQALAKSYESITAQLERQIALSGDNSQLGRINYEISSGNLRGLSQSDQQNLRNLAGVADIEADYAALYSGMDTLQAKGQETTSILGEYGVQAARNMQSAFADLLFDPFADGLDGMLTGFLKTLQRMAAEAAASQIFQAVGSAASSYTGQGAGWINAIGSVLSNGKSEGGYTGYGGKYEPAGIVHRGEVVWSQADVKAVGGPSRANAMRPTAGYATGGIVGSSIPRSMGQNAGPQITFIMSMQDGNITTKQQGGGADESTRELKQMFEAMINQWWTKNNRPGGAVYNNRMGTA